MLMAQLSSNLTLTHVFLAGTHLFLSKLVSRLRVHKCVSGNLWQSTPVRHAKLLVSLFMSGKLQSCLGSNLQVN